MHPIPTDMKGNIVGSDCLPSRQGALSFHQGQQNWQLSAAAGMGRVQAESSSPGPPEAEVAEFSSQGPLSESAAMRQAQGRGRMLDEPGRTESRLGTAAGSTAQARTKLLPFAVPEKVRGCTRSVQG